MLGPTGIGVLYGKYSLLDKTSPINFGGGMNTSFEANGEFEYKAVFDKLFESNEKLGISYHINSKVEILARRLKQIYEVDQEIILQDIKAIILKGGNKSGKRQSN